MAQNDVLFIGSMPQFYDRHMGALFFQRYAVKNSVVRRADPPFGALAAQFCRRLLAAKPGGMAASPSRPFQGVYATLGILLGGGR
jgi:hypothetical protein